MISRIARVCAAEMLSVPVPFAVLVGAVLLCGVREFGPEFLHCLFLIREMRTLAFDLLHFLVEACREQMIEAWNEAI